MNIMKKIATFLMAFAAVAFVGCSNDSDEDDVVPGEPSITEETGEGGGTQGSGTPQTFTVNDVSFTMMPVEGGTFTMGADYSTPLHNVTLNSYMIGETEVTQSLWQTVMGYTPTSGGNQWSSTYGVGAEYPAYYISWNDVQEFIAKLNQLTGKTFRMPTEAEWEYAARGGNKSKGYLYSGSNTIGDVAWYTVNSHDMGSSSPDYGTHPVKTKSPNELGLYDMSGNVLEWCSDRYSSYSSEAQRDPQGPSSGSGRILRGGSWTSSTGYCRVADRYGSFPLSRNNFLGFRLALSVPQTFTVKGVSFTMVPVEGGTFTMGATQEQQEPYDNETPTHSVTLSSYMMGETEVTQGLWQAVMGYTPTSDGEQWSSKYSMGAEYPAYYISWDDVQAFITKLNQLTGKTFRMPTEAEWEFAARGGNKSNGYQYSGSNTIDDVAWYYDNGGYNLHPVKTKSPNELGLYDMSGNVYEWCNDWYGSYSSEAQQDPKGPSSGSDRVNRGGGWGSYAWGCRVALRSYDIPSFRHYGLGFRLALGL